MSRIARSTLILAFFYALEKLLGFVRQVAIARTFGLSATLDAFYASNNIPDLLFYLISGGALALAFIPVLSEYLEKQGRPAMWDLFSRLVNLVFLVTAGLSILVAIFARQLVGWQLGIAPGFTPEQQQLVTELMRMHLIATLFLSLGGLVAGSLQTNQHFFLPAMALSMYDLGTLFGIFILVPETGLQLGPLTLPAFGLGIRGLVYGAILGSAFFFLVQTPGLARFGFHWTPAIDLRHPGIRQMLGLLGPRVLTIFSIQITYLAQDNIASRLFSGNITALVYGWLFMQVPETIIGTAIATALLPTLSEQMARGEQEAYCQSLGRTIQVILAFTIPIAALVAFVLRPVVAILGFNEAGLDLVLWTARLYLLGLVGHALLDVVVRAFYAQQDARTPLLTAVLTTIAFIILAILLGFPLGAPGIALANALAFTGEALLLLYLLSRRFPGLLQVKRTLLRATLAAALAAGLACLILSLPLAIPELLQAVLAAGVGGLAILPLIWPEVKILVKL
jgi:putative peptidoglycan lipid II flippase